MNEDMIPITLFLVIGLITAAFFYFRYRARADMQRTIQAALDKGHELSPELIDRLGEPKKSKFADLRKGVMAVGLAIAVAAFGVLVDEEEAIRPLLAIAVLPLTIGIAYMILWRFGLSDAQDDSGPR